VFFRDLVAWVAHVANWPSQEEIIASIVGPKGPFPLGKVTVGDQEYRK
jgi:hypothetical protein